MKYVLMLFLIFFTLDLDAATLPASTTVEVNLTWNAPVSNGDPVADYDIFKSPDGASDYEELGNTTATSFTDNTSFAYDMSYDYYVTSVDAEGNQSSPSNTAVVPIPFVPYTPVVGIISGT
jgi:fibronectin type 3 domain-containing protein